MQYHFRMTAPVRMRMTREEYLSWEDSQETKHELVNGEVRAMAGAKVRHNLIAGNLFAALKASLKGTPCRPFSSDLRCAIPKGNYRYPDLTVDCGKPSLDAMYADRPTLIIEVLSESNDWFDVSSRLEDYQSLPTVKQIAFLSSDEPRADLWTRSEVGWRKAELVDMAAALDFMAVGACIAFAEAYEGVFDER